MHRWLIKIGGSLIAPKEKIDFIDKKLLKKLRRILISCIWYNFSIIHWTWNFWHRIVKEILSKTTNNLKFKKGVSILLKANYDVIRKKLDFYNKEIDKFFPFLKRYYPWNLDYNEENFLCGWDIDPNSWNIISSDDVFWTFLNRCNKIYDKYLILTDVDGVFDKNWNIINVIDKNNFSKIRFWSKDNDVSWGMKAKIKAILGKWPVYILNGRNFKNLYNFFSWKKFVWTLVL